MVQKQEAMRPGSWTQARSKSIKSPDEPEESRVAYDVKRGAPLGYSKNNTSGVLFLLLK